MERCGIRIWFLIVHCHTSHLLCKSWATLIFFKLAYSRFIWFELISLSKEWIELWCLNTHLFFLVFDLLVCCLSEWVVSPWPQIIIAFISVLVWTVHLTSWCLIRWILVPVLLILLGESLYLVVIVKIILIKVHLIMISIHLGILPLVLIHVLIVHLHLVLVLGIHVLEVVRVVVNLLLLPWILLLLHRWPLLLLLVHHVWLLVRSHINILLLLLLITVVVPLLVWIICQLDLKLGAVIEFWSNSMHLLVPQSILRCLGWNLIIRNWLLLAIIVLSVIIVVSTKVKWVICISLIHLVVHWTIIALIVSKVHLPIVVVAILLVEAIVVVGIVASIVVEWVVVEHSVAELVLLVVITHHVVVLVWHLLVESVVLASILEDFIRIIAILIVVWEWVLLTWHASIVLVLVSIFVVLEIKLLILLKIVVALQHVWRCLVADHIQWLLKVMENYLTRFLKPCDLYFNDVSNAFLVFFDILDAFVIFDHTWDSKIQTAENNSFLYVLHKGKDIRIDFECAHINNVSVDESISIALPCITEDLVVELGCALINFTAFCHIINDIFLKDIHASHLLIHLW